MVDPLEAAVAFLRGRDELSVLSDRIAGQKHRYGEGWAVGDTGLVAVLDGGTPELYVPTQRTRLEMRAYAGGAAAAMDVYRALVVISRVAERVLVEVSDDDQAFIYWFLPVSGSSMLFDDDLGMDLLVAFFEIHVSEVAVA